MALPIAPHRDSRSNLLLACLADTERAELSALGEQVSIGVRRRLYDADDPIEHAYFPLSGLVSVVATTREGQTVEVGPVGRDGMIGLPIFLGGGSDPLEAFVEVAPLEALRVPALLFAATAERLAGLQRVMRLYVQWSHFSMAQWVLCARVHPLEERLSRWLLLVADHVQAGRFPLTHEFLAEMLGTPRTTVTIATGTLRKAGLVDYTDGVVTLLNRAGLEQTSCECQRRTDREYRRLFRRDAAAEAPVWAVGPASARDHEHAP